LRIRTGYQEFTDSARGSPPPIRLRKDSIEMYHADNSLKIHAPKPLEAEPPSVADPDPFDFAGSGSVYATPDPDPAVVLLLVVLLLVVLLLVALLGTGDDSFNPLRTWYRGVSYKYDRDRYPDFSGPS